MRILLLGGTREARDLAADLTCRGVDVVSSLAGRVRNPTNPSGATRSGGFGGPAGLTRFLIDESITAIVDATHPFAESITRNAAVAAAQTRVPSIILRRPGWSEQPGDRWTRVADVATAASIVAAGGSGTIFLTIGRRDLTAFAGDQNHHYLVRTVDPPDGVTPSRMTLLLARGPYAIDTERSLMTEHAVTTLVTKDSGGELTRAKLVAARELNLPVIVVDRPPLPAQVQVVSTLTEVRDWLVQLGFAAQGPNPEPAD